MGVGVSEVSGPVRQRKEREGNEERESELGGIDVTCLACGQGKF